MLVNLLSNALKFTPAGGEITVRVGADPQRPAEMRVSVSETGRGSRRRNWARFSISSIRCSRDDATVQGGLGLGLYISQEVVKLHGGEIWVEGGVREGQHVLLHGAPVSGL